MKIEHQYYNSLLLYNQYPSLLYEKILTKKIRHYMDYLNYVKEHNKIDTYNICVKIIHLLKNKKEKLIQYNNQIITYKFKINVLTESELKRLENNINTIIKKYLKYINILLNNIENE